MKFVVPTYIHARTLHDEVMILDTRNNGYLGLNQTGAAVWDVLTDGRPVSDAVETLVMSFNVDARTAEDDVDALVGNLQELGIITPHTI